MWIGLSDAEQESVSDGSTETFYITLNGTSGQPTKNRTEDGTQTVSM